jgi:serine/threonine-protein kinase
MPNLRTETRVTQLGAKPAAAPDERRSFAGAFLAVGLLAVLMASGGAIVYALGLWPFGGSVEELAGGPSVPTVPAETDVTVRPEEPATVTPVELPPAGQPPADAPTGPTDGGPAQSETGVSPPSQESPPPVEPTEVPGGGPTVPPVVIPPADGGPAGEPTLQEPVVAPAEDTGAPGSTPDIPPPEEPPATEEPPLTRLAQVEKYVRDYSGGSCFFVTPLDISEEEGVPKARLEVFSSEATPAEALDKAFHATQGFEAQLGVRLVTPDQCPAVNFLHRVAREPGKPPTMTLTSFDIPRGHPLTGSLDGLDGRRVALLLVSDTGVVTDVSADAAPSGDGLAFTVRPETMRAPAARPNLLIALATREPLGLPSSSLPAGDYFPLVKAAAEQSNQEIGVAVKYFKMGG